MPSTFSYLRTRKPIDYGVTPGTTTFNRQGLALWRRFVNVFTGSLGGAYSDSDYTVGYSSNNPVKANYALAVSGGSGAVGAVLNGVTVTGTAAGTDTAIAAIIAAAINASSNALVAGFVKASNLSCVVTCASVAAGDVLWVGDDSFTAITGAAPNIISGGNVGVFDRSGSNTATAGALAAAINASSQYFFAVSAAALVYIFPVDATYASPSFSFPTAAGFPPNTIRSQNTTMSCSSNGVVASVNVGLITTVPGIHGNAITAAASGTGVSSVDGGARFSRGVGPTVFVSDSCSGG